MISFFIPNLGGIVWGCTWFSMILMAHLEIKDHKLCIARLPLNLSGIVSSKHVSGGDGITRVIRHQHIHRINGNMLFSPRKFLPYLCRNVFVLWLLDMRTKITLLLVACSDAYNLETISLQRMCWSLQGSFEVSIAHQQLGIYFNSLIPWCFFVLQLTSLFSLWSGHMVPWQFVDL